MKNLDKTYQPKGFEGRIYQTWKQSGSFTPVIDRNRESYTIVMPPPNVTGNLHLGHAMNNTIQDILIRWKRMEGFSALWLPGTDHASISTEAKVVEKLKKQGITKEDLGREGFLKEAWAWTHEYGGNIKKQLEKLGVSCDWTRDSFTLDENLTLAVEAVFIKMYQEGLIYQGDRIVNWCVSCGTAISDAEVEHEDTEGHLYYVKYFFKDSDDFISIATTRPETILGDLAVAVNPEDERYKRLVGKILILPLVNREIPLIADDYVDLSFGTGAVKITPSHDPNDFEVGERHQLGQCRIIEGDGNISAGYGIYSGLNRFEARKKIIEDLSQQGYLIKVEKHKHAVGHCERCNTTIEPLISKQWFVKMKDLALPAVEAYTSGELKFIPDRFGKVYLNWLDNIKDWCISRQLWWGHRLPVYYCQDCDEIIVTNQRPDHCTKCNSTNLIQDEDTLDTWFSSALWPFSTLGWPKDTEDLRYFFPTDVLVTGYDILFFWVIRMVFSSLHNMGQIPFEYVYFTGLIRDAEGRKMSKSLNNGIDPIDVIDQYGADALRFTLVTGNSPGNDMRFYMEKVEANRNFANKLWNASRFVLMNLEEDDQYPLDPLYLEIEDKWIMSRMNSVIKEATENLNRFEIGLAASKLYDFIWNEYCDWYIEFVKTRLYGDDLRKKKIARGVLLSVLTDILKLLHPFMPFITEEIYSYLPTSKQMLIDESWPVYLIDKVYPSEEKIIQAMISCITAIRNARSEINIPHGKKSELYLIISDSLLEECFKGLEHHFKSLASIREVNFLEKDPLLKDSIQLVLENIKMYIPLTGLIDYEKELMRLEKDLKNLQNEITRASGKLSNPNFLRKAPPKVVEEEQTKLYKYQKMFEELQTSIQTIKEKQ